MAADISGDFDLRCVHRGGGTVVAWMWGAGVGRRAGLDASRIDLLMPLVLGTGLLGAWLFGFFTDEATGGQEHGAVLVGSLLVATGAGVGYGFASRMPLGVLGDVVSGPLGAGDWAGTGGVFFRGVLFWEGEFASDVFNGRAFSGGVVCVSAAGG